jgi:hypothetical protein
MGKNRLQISRRESHDTLDTTRDNATLRHMVSMDLSDEDEQHVHSQPQQSQSQGKPMVWTPSNISADTSYSLSTTTDGGLEVGYPADDDGMAKRDSLALDIDMVPKEENMVIVSLPFWDDMPIPIPRHSSTYRTTTTIKSEKYWTNRRKRLAFLIAACLIVVMVCSLVVVGRNERRGDESGGGKNLDQVNSAAEDTVTTTTTTAPSDHSDVSFVAPTAAPVTTTTTAPITTTTTPPMTTTTTAPVWVPTAHPTSAPNYDFLQTTLAYQVLSPKVEDPSLLFLPDTPQGSAFQILVDEQSTYNWTPFRIAQRYALMVLYLSSSHGNTWNWNQGWRGFTNDECAWYGIDTCRMQPHGELAVGTLGLSTFTFGV